ncbi:DUF4054 domain-containing protein [Achromobacter sp. Marseille-Q0513]|uniref:DUF4054 domain-containing protein n=1 Tax=Achromobacter sp. Marseille-Q0513 TaxID=2829161 RepID=UPI001B92AAEB|nr:DUF4054 domain-containing protein [Achromobacter sp. Marseille-Q0513]MBR8654200.1 DUF4054 domain-containing protein [Achromobacter sp. Marseille-Q0513]
MNITPAIIADFRQYFSGQYSSVTVWPDHIIEEVLCEADAETGGSGWGAFSLECNSFKRRGMYLFAAHWLEFFYGDNPANGVGGIARLNTQSKTVGDESIAYRVASMMDAGNDALTYTVYGQQFYRLRRRAGMGARVI